MTDHINDALRAELEAMAAEDQRIRAELLAEGVLFDGYHPRMAEVHRRNAARLQAIFDTIGFPGRSIVGENGARAAWMILQHSIGSPAVMRRGLELVRDAVKAGDAAPIELAMLEDRVRSYSGLPQRYGTQFDWDENGEMNPSPIENPAIVEDLRQEVGLPPLAEKLRQVREGVAREKARPPADLAERRRGYEAWRREVGWI
jgi:hypothetical protein